MATPVTLVPNGTPVANGPLGAPVTIVGVSGQADVAVVSNGDALVVPVTGTYVDTATVTVEGGVVTAIALS